MTRLKQTTPWIRCFHCSAAVVVVLSLSTMIAGSDPPDNQDVDVTVTVQDPDGEGLEQVPLILLSEKDAQFAFTDVNGVAQFTIGVSPDEDQLAVFMSMGFGLPVIPPEQRLAPVDRYHQLREEYGFKRAYYVMINDGGPFSFLIKPADAIHITGRLVDPDGAPVVGGIGAEFTLAHDLIWPHDDGQFALGGIAKGEDTVLWYYGGDSSEWHRTALPGVLLHADIHLGDLVLANQPLNATVSITSTNYEQMHLKDKLDLAQDMTLIERSSLAVFGYYVVRGTGEVRQRLPDNVPPEELLLPAGEYFIVPGKLFNLPSRAAYAALLDGKAQDMEDADVPLMTIQPGGNDPVTIDAKAAVEAIMEVGGELVDE